MLEQRLGRPGYHLGTGIVLAAAMSIILTPFGMLAGMLVGIVIFLDLSVPKAAGDIGFAVALSICAGAVMYLMSRLVTRRERRLLKEQGEEIQWDMDFHATHGDHLVVIISGEDAKKQWPEIESRIRAWEREQKGIEGSESE